MFKYILETHSSSVRNKVSQDLKKRYLKLVQSMSNVRKNKKSSFKFDVVYMYCTISH